MSTMTVKRGTFKRSCRTCGWSGEYATAGRGDYAKRKHSCDKHRELQGRKLRGEFRRSLVDRTPQPCLHKEAQHEHGTYACYTLDRCRCRPCGDAAAAYERNRVRQIAYGRSNMVDAEPVRAHVRALMDQGMGLKRIAAAAPVSTGQMWKLLYGVPRPDGDRRPPAKRVTKATAEKLLSVRLDLAPSAVVDGKDTTRRLQALVALGYSQTYLAAELGVDRSNFTPLSHGTRDVTATMAKAVHALYVRLADQEPPQETEQQRTTMRRTRNYAKKRGWAPPVRVGGRLVAGAPLPVREVGTGETPPRSVRCYDEAVVLRLLAGDRSVKASRADRAETVRRWAAAGRPLNELERHTGINVHRYTREAS